MKRAHIDSTILPGTWTPGTERFAVVASRGRTGHHSLTTTLFLLEEGRVALGPPQHPLEASPGTAWVLPADQFVARYVLTNGARWRELRFADALPPSAPFPVTWAQAVAFEDAVGSNRPDAELPLPDPLPEPWPCTRPIRKARTLIKHQLTIGMEELADHVRVPAHVLSRKFRREVGTTPHQYQLAVRLSCATQDLRRGVPPPDAAIRAGFYDQSHLGRHMRRRLGLTPGTYATAFAR